MNYTHFKEKVIIVTGASSGIGKELSLQLAKRGARLALASRNKEKLEEVAEECRKYSNYILTVPTDVAKETDCKNLIKETIQAFDRIDILVNNAGISMWSYFEEMINMKALENIMQVNYFGSVYCTHYALPHLIESKGQIVGVSSLTGKTGVPTRSGYGASKHAMAGFFDALRIELKEKGVAVTMIYPGFVATEVRERAMGPDGKALGTGNSPVKEGQVMTVERCVQIMLPVIEKRKRELIMTLRGKLGLWVKLIAPGLVDKIALKAIKSGK
ncbi:MAG: SDR family oxidoreductase [Bacteroidales bacterium]|nr:SDR family oxidoreductase [Bacteroidales bacterium]